MECPGGSRRVCRSRKPQGKRRRATWATLDSHSLDALAPAWPGLNQVWVRRQIFTSISITGTSMRTPTTVARAAPLERPCMHDGRGHGDREVVARADPGRGGGVGVGELERAGQQVGDCEDQHRPDQHRRGHPQDRQRVGEVCSSRGRHFFNRPTVAGFRHRMSERRRTLRRPWIPPGFPSAEQD